MDRKRKRELRDLNAGAWAGETDIFPANGSLDSSLKKNTAFIKRLRTAVTSASLNTFLSDIRTLSLHKYLSEIISACYEGLTKLKSPGEISAGVEIVSALHQRFGPSEFTKYLGWLLGRGLTPPDKFQLKTLSPDAREKEEKERLARHRVLLKVVTEFWLVGILRSLDDVERPDDASTKVKDPISIASIKAKSASATAKAPTDTESEPYPLEVLKELLGHDRDHANLPLAVLFVKNYTWDILGVKSTADEGRKSVEEDGITTTAEQATKGDNVSSGDEDNISSSDKDSPLVSSELRQRFKNILGRYLDDVKKHVIKDQKSLAAQGRRNAEAYVKSGEIFEDRQANYDKQIKAQEKLVANTQVLCEALGSEMPDLTEKEAADATTAGSIGLVKAGEYLRGQGEGAGIWEDEEERRFYENLVDLKGKVPGILLEDGKKKKADNEDQATKKIEENSNGEVKEGLEAAATAAKPAEPDDQSIVIANKSVGAQVDILLTRLTEMQTKDQVDQAAIDFCFLNSKASRNRLLKGLQEVPKGRSDLLPLYARLIATLGRHLPDISQTMVTALDDEFRSLQRRKQKDFLGQVRMSNIRYLAELTKFGIVPEHIIFHCLKVSLDDFSKMNIEIISSLLENCGRYLLRNPETTPRMSSFLETLQRKKSAQHLGQQERMLLENAMYYVDPPERAAIQQKERTPVELFIRKLVYLDMNKRNYTKVLKSIRKLHWEEQEVVDILEKIFSKPGKVKYSNIHLLAILVGALYRYHQDFVIMVVDNLLEHITVGLEQNDFKFNQRRLAEVKYLGELYNYKMVDSPVIFDTLYRIVTFGHEGGTPRPGRLNLLDLPDDFFRVRLVCTLIETCGLCFDRGSAKKKFDFFLTFFQYYLFTKDTLPMDIEFIIQDTFALTRPDWKLATNLEDAARAFSEAVAQNYKTQGPDKAAEPEEAEDEISSNDGADDDDIKVPDMEEGQSSNEDAEVPDNDVAEHSESSSEEEQIIVTRPEEEHDPEADAEFEREYEKMMAESLESRKFERKPIFDVPLPMRRATREPSITGEDVPSNGTNSTNTMAFSLMTKRGNKQQTRTIELPSNSQFAVAMRTQQQAEREEQQRIKNLVLNYDLRDDNDQDDGDSNNFHYFINPNPNTKGSKGLERHNASQPIYPHAHPKAEKTGPNRGGYRARKLQLSDVDWYDQKRSKPNARGNRKVPIANNEA
ncbi:MAG: hypothetical protein M1834_009190 [Cirrosporium novae-zelandiae]|nr:MAG: hypothetical protein M1834_009190 [Cirrosporium novae-zelandiae]